MLEKWKQKAIQMNLKKTVTSFVVVSVIFMLVSSGILYARFRDKIDTWEATIEDRRGYEKKKISGIIKQMMNRISIPIPMRNITGTSRKKKMRLILNTYIWR